MRVAFNSVDVGHADVGGPHPSVEEKKTGVPPGRREKAFCLQVASGLRTRALALPAVSSQPVHQPHPGRETIPEINRFSVYTSVLLVLFLCGTLTNIVPLPGNTCSASLTPPDPEGCPAPAGLSLPSWAGLGADLAINQAANSKTKSWCFLPLTERSLRARLRASPPHAPPRPLTPALRDTCHRCSY